MRTTLFEIMETLHDGLFDDESIISYINTLFEEGKIELV